MSKYEIVEPGKKYYDSFYDDSLPFRVIRNDLTADEANRFMFRNMEYRFYARDMETGELYHKNTTGLKKVNK